MKKSLGPSGLVVLAMAFFTLAAAIWALRVSAPETLGFNINPDELSHVAVARYMALERSLPPYTVEFYESSHPPLYHALAAAVLAAVPERAGLFALRSLSLVLGLGTIWIAYRTALRVARPWSAAVAACFVGVLPAFVLVGGAVSNDPLAAALSAAALYWIVRGTTSRFGSIEIAATAALVALTCLTKYTALGLVPVAIVGMLLASRRRPVAGFGGAVAVLLTTAAATGWWFARNVALYGDPLRSQAEDKIITFAPGYSGQGATYWLEVGRFLAGSFLGLTPDYPGWPEPLMNGLAALFVLAVILSAVGLLRLKRSPVVALLALHIALVACVFLAYQVRHFQPHARLLFPALPVLAIAVVAGLRRVLPESKQMPVAAMSLGGLAALSLALVLLSPIN